MSWVLWRILFGVARIPRMRIRYRSMVDDDARDAIAGAELARITAWTTARKLADRGIVVDAGCDGSSPRGVEITIAARGLVDEPILVTAKKRSEHVLDALLDDIDLRGSLRAITITPEAFTLTFVPLRATDVYGVALRRVEELLAPRGRSATNAPDGHGSPYR